MLSSIYKSKFYLASVRKSQIRAAIANPMNKELVVQLQSYLDNVVDKDDVMPKDSEDIAPEGKNTESKDKNTNKKHSSAPKTKGGATSPPLSFHDAGEDTEESVTEEAPPVEEKATAESSYKADTTISTDVLMGQLNVVTDTSGVSRIEIHDEEVWIYYQDSVNLNNIIDSVIKTVNSAGYPLEFNRFARTNNAIVFMITRKVIS